MDEIAVLASAASAILAAGFTRLLVKPESPVIAGTRQLETVDSAHKHEATSMNAGGWHCDCGKHLHSFNLNGKCMCGAEGTGKVWA